MYYVTLTIPLAQYDTFLERVDPSSRVCVLLKEAVFERTSVRGHFERAMKLVCKKAEAVFLLDAAQNLCPEIIPTISRGWLEI